MPEPASIPPRGSAPFHPLSSTLLLVVDNLWNLADWAAAAWVFTIPLSFLSVAAPVAMIQRRLHGDSWGRALLKGFFLGILAGVPTSITGTPVGIALLAWAGIDRMNRGNAALPASLASPPLPPNPNEGALPPPTEPTTVAPPLTPPPRVSQAHWVWLAIVVVLCASGLVATKLVLDRAGKLAGTIFENTSRIAEKFSQGKITETFTAALPVLTHQPGGNLELATATATETFTRTDERSIAWDMIPLGKTVTEITAPVTYRYHLRLQDPWRLEVRGATCVVHAPTIRSSQPPAINTYQMQKRTLEKGWARFDAQEQMAELEKTITAKAARWAEDPEHIALVREECRKTVAEFVRDWLLKEDQWRTDRFRTIKVIFPEETGVDADLARPVVELK